MNFIFELIECFMLKKTIYSKINDDPIWLIKSLLVVSVTAVSVATTVVVDPSENLKQVLDDAGSSRSYYASICIVSTFLGWVIWSILTHFVGIRLYYVRQREITRSISYRLTLRATGFAYLPGVLILLLLAPFSIEWEKMICLFIWLWILVVATIGTRHLHECGTIRALNSTLPGWFISGAILYMFLYP